MPKVTYGKLFDESLEGIISAGGDVGTIVNLVNAYQKTDVTNRHYVFQDWLEANALFSCTSCGKPFAVDKYKIEEDHYVRCPKCRKN